MSISESVEELPRRLLAILAADAAGYSRLMAADEQGTVTALESARRIVGEQVGLHGGRVVDAAGDSVLAVFPAAYGAVAASIAIQGGLRDLEDRRLRFRIGLHPAMCLNVLTEPFTATTSTSLQDSKHSRRWVASPYQIQCERRSKAS